MTIAAHHSPTALGQPCWFFGMLAEVNASAAETGGQSPRLAEPTACRQASGAFVDSRTRHSGAGGDHDPAWVTLGL